VVAYRVANAGWCVLLLYCVAVQYNDPDPLRWMLAYGIGAVVCGIAAYRGEVPVRPVVAWGVLSLVLAGLDFAYGVGQVDPMGGFPDWGPLRDEVIREALGLSLMAGWMIALAIWTHRRQNAS
jgi:hypothetical protein